jgi:hypothetical protein
VTSIPVQIAGRVDRVYAALVGIQVKKGDRLEGSYSTERLVAETQLLRCLGISYEGPG